MIRYCSWCHDLVSELQRERCLGLVRESASDANETFATTQRLKNSANPIEFKCKFDNQSLLRVEWILKTMYVDVFNLSILVNNPI